MNNKHIIEYLDYFIKYENINFSVLLKGCWGSGKTFFIKKLIEKWSTPNIADDEFIALNPIYISLNGLSSKKEIIIKLKEQISPFLYSKGAKVASSIIKGFIKSTLKIDFDYDGDNKADGAINLNFDPISIFKADNENIKGNRIIIFDDIERCKIPVDEIYGFINDFVEHSKCKIILISDEDKIIKRDEDEKSLLPYTSFKEKIIGQVFEIKPNSDEAIEYFISQLNYETKIILLENKSLIYSIFNASDKKNLRVLQRALFNYERLLGLIKPNLKEIGENYKLLTKSLLAYYLIFHIEYNTGNLNIGNFQQLFLVDEKKYDFQSYEEAIKSFSLLHSTKIFSAENLLQFISHGNYEELVNEINNCYIFHPTTEKDWEKLWYWKFLSDSEFEEILPKVEREFFEQNTLHFTEVLHISGIFINLIDNDLYNSKTKSEIILRAKELFSTAKDLEKVTDLHLILRGSWRKSYASEFTVEFKEILNSLKDFIKLSQTKSMDKYVEDTLYSLNNDNVDDLYEAFKKYDWVSGNILERTPLFKDISAEKISDIIFNLNNQAIFNLNGYFNYRYFPEKTYSNLTIEDFHKQELKFINTLRAKLTELLSSIEDKPIKTKTIKNFIEDLEKISLRLNK
ncbi:P-loop NTPase fold protein [Riemerella anatipestifer]|uniref:P-loop NTPase fold protein n=1 Tax=Riemerella anatipestifer TaxID=34085 RepID=UPI0030C13F28